MNIFVFGSNLRGVHGAGAAHFAMMHKGAVYGQGEGCYGNSYALPTKDVCIYTLPLDEIQKHVTKFIKFAEENQYIKFELTRVGCGLAGYTDDQIAPLFKGMPYNVMIDSMWQRYYPDHTIWHYTN